MLENCKHHNTMILAYNDNQTFIHESLIRLGRISIVCKTCSKEEVFPKLWRIPTPDIRLSNLYYLADG